MLENSGLYSKNFRNEYNQSTRVSEKINKQQNRDQIQQRALVGIRVFCIEFISIWPVLSINTGELFPLAGKAKIREGGKSENVANEENKL